MTNPWTGANDNVSFVCTPITPGMASASVVSTDVMRA